MYSHETSYRGANLNAFLHRRRLKTALSLIATSTTAPTGTLADFGCSDGFVISQIQKHNRPGSEWEYFGFDVEPGLLDSGRKRGLPDTEFHRFDLNEENHLLQREFDVVTCFESMEHIGNCRNALINLYRACKVDGSILISIPNESNLPGLFKYLARKVLRRNAYGQFFDRQSELVYVWSLLTNKSIQSFRPSTVPYWGYHLGFDWKAFDRHVQHELIEGRHCELVLKQPTLFRFGFFYVLKKKQL